MIEFQGSISEKNQLDRMKKLDKKVTKVSILGLIFIWLVVIAIGLPLRILQDLWGELIFCSLIMLSAPILSAYTPKKVILRFRISPHIIITEKDLSIELRSNGKEVWRTRKISKVKKVLDCGEVYYIIFKFGDITNSWICQKNNIINGTIEEFESLFQTKLVKETKPFA